MGGKTHCLLQRNLKSKGTYWIRVCPKTVGCFWLHLDEIFKKGLQPLKIYFPVDIPVVYTTGLGSSTSSSRSRSYMPFHTNIRHDGMKEPAAFQNQITVVICPCSASSVRITFFLFFFEKNIRSFRRNLYTQLCKLS